MRNDAGFNIQKLPIPIVGGNSFGRFAKISTSETFNMMVADNTLVPFAGYQKIADISGVGGEGRGLYSSTQYNHMIAVVDNFVYSIGAGNSISRLFEIQTQTGDVYIAENQASQIGIADGLNIYIFNYATNAIETTQGVDFLPSYLDYQDGYFISCGVNTSGQFPIYNQWRLSNLNDGRIWNGSQNGGPPNLAGVTGELQSKADVCVATVNFNRQLFVFGRKVTEVWSDVGYTLFPYQRNNYLNIDYGCLNPATIATGSIQYGENQDLIPLICWLGINEKSGPTIMYSMGGSPVQLSTDGINFKIEELRHPENSYGFIYRLAGHTIYQIVWPMDNLSYAIDFNTKQFFTVTDENLNYHIAKRVAFFNNKYYFLSLNDGALYETSAHLYTYNYDTTGNTDTSLTKEIPRIRVLPPLKLPDASRYVCNYQNITMEQGQFKNSAALLLSKSKDGGLSYGSPLRKELQPFADRQNICRFWQLGSANDARFKYQFWGFDRFVVTNGEAGIYQ